MDAKRLYSMDEQKFAEHAMVQKQSQEQVQQLVKLVEDQVCRLFDKDQSSCNQCVERVMEKEGSLKIPA